MEKRGLLESHWQQSESNRRAKYYRLTGRGRSYLKAEIASWQALSGAIDKVLGSTRIAGA
jgi:DNA-binding PadR family transcriptional regulator